MSKAWDERPVGQNQQAKTDTFNKNIEKYIGEFNGNLNGNNMPVDALTSDQLSLPGIPEIDYSVGDVTRESSRVPTQSYYSTRAFEWENTDVWTPIQSINLINDNWRRGWNKLEDFSPFGGWPLRFEAREGMLVGCATIDWHHGTNRVNYVTEEGSFANWIGGDWWTEWGVFANGVLVGRSGEIYPKRHTTSIPFSIPTGSGPVRIDVRFRTVTWTGTANIVIANPSTLLDIFGGEIWTRNVYR